MSGIFGIFQRNGDSVSATSIQTMLDAMSYWGPDRRGLWREGPVGLIHAMLWNTPESKLERLPLTHNQLVITLDTRLDGRDELTSLLDITGRSLNEITDSDLILAAYCKWGEDCPQYLTGDFAFAIWDRNKQQLFCARDHVGVKQFYFHLSDSHFIFANDLKILEQHRAISEEINNEAVANFLVNHQLKSPTLTFFKAVEKLPPAHSLTITATKTQKTCYWRLEDTPRVKLDSSDSYAQRLRELLEQAVHDRLRSDYPITSHLSGGLDSSTIAVIAARKLREKREKLLAFNWLHKPEADDDPNYYEWSNSNTIAKAEGIDHHYVSISAEDICKHMKERTVVYGDTSAFWYEYPVRSAAGANKSRTILCGWGGDELASYHGQAYYSDLMLHGRFLRVVKELWQTSSRGHGNRARKLIGRFYHQVFTVLVPRKLYRFMPRNGDIKAEQPRFISGWFRPAITKELRKKTSLSAQPQRTIRNHMMAYWQNGHIQARIESWAAAAIPNRLEYSYPLLDRRVLEFVAGVPAECFVYRGQGRHLFKSAAKGLIPDEILFANEKIEIRRVERLLTLSLSAWKSFAASQDPANREHSRRESSFIDTRELNRTINEMDTLEVDRETLQLSQRISTSLALVLSKQLVDLPQTRQYVKTSGGRP